MAFEQNPNIQEKDVSVSQPLSYAVDTVEKMLSSTALQSSWDLKNFSQRKTYPGPDIGKELEQLKNTSEPGEEHAPILFLMRELIRTERKAMGKASDKDSRQKTILREELQGAEDYLSQAIPGRNLNEALWSLRASQRPNLPQALRVYMSPSALSLMHKASNAWDRYYADPLPVASQRLLQAEKAATRQGSIKPVRAALRFGGHIAGEIKEAATHEKRLVRYPFLAMLPVAGMMAHEMSKIAGGKTTVLNPEALGLTDMMLLTGGNDITLDNAAVIADAMGERSCHDHIANLAEAMTFKIADGNTVADALTRSGVPIPQDCSFINDISGKAESAAGTFLRGYKELYWDQFGAGRVAEASDAIQQASPVMDGVRWAAHPVSQGFLTFDIAENASLHPLMFFAGVGLTAAYILGKVKQADMQKLGQEFHENGVMKNLAYRTIKKPLGAAFGLASAGLTYQHYGMDPAMVWAAIAGVTAGYTAHLAADISRRKQHVFQVMGDARKNLGEFTKAARGKVLGLPEPDTKNIPAGKITAGAAAAAYMGAVALHTMQTGDLGYSAQFMAGAGAVSAGILGWYIPTNLVQDTIQHVIFSGSGSAVTYVMLSPVVAYLAMRYMKDQALNDFKKTGQKVENFLRKRGEGIKAAFMVGALALSPMAAAPSDGTPLYRDETDFSHEGVAWQPSIH